MQVLVQVIKEALLKIKAIVLNATTDIRIAHTVIIKKQGAVKTVSFYSPK